MKLLYAEDEAAMSEAVVDMELYLGESKWSRNIKEQTRRLSGLMQDLLTLARMDEGAALAQKAALSLSGLAEQALEPFLQPMEAQGITLERDIQPEVSLTADPAQLEQLLSLLLDNAVKYTGPGGRIRLSVKQEGKRARLCLENTCPQLPTVPPEKLFDRFYRGDAAAAPVQVPGDVPPAEAVPVKKMPVFSEESPKFTKVEILCKESRFEALKTAMMDIGITGMTMSHVLGCGLQKGKPEYYRGVQVEATLLPKVQVDIVVSKVPVRTVIETAKKVLYTGHIGDGKIFVYDVENVVKVRTGEEGYDALQDVE